VGLDDLLEEGFARGVDPVEVLDEHHAPLWLPVRLDDAPRDREQPALERVRVHGRCRALWVRHPRRSKTRESASRSVSSRSRRRPAICARATRSASRPVMPKKARNSSSIGSSGICFPWATPRVSYTEKPRARQRSANSKQRRLLPRPGGATTPTTCPGPLIPC